MVFNKKKNIVIRIASTKYIVQQNKQILIYKKLSLNFISLFDKKIPGIL